MTIEQLRSFHRAQPFRPFEMYLADGRVLSIPHPENLAIADPRRTVEVTSLTPLGDSAKQPRNGRDS